MEKPSEPKAVAYSEAAAPTCGFATSGGDPVPGLSLLTAVPLQQPKSLVTRTDVEPCGSSRWAFSGIGGDTDKPVLPGASVPWTGVKPGGPSRWAFAGFGGTDKSVFRGASVGQFVRRFAPIPAAHSPLASTFTSGVAAAAKPREGLSEPPIRPSSPWQLSANHLVVLGQTWPELRQIILAALSPFDIVCKKENKPFKYTVTMVHRHRPVTWRIQVWSIAEESKTAFGVHHGYVVDVRRRLGCGLLFCNAFRAFRAAVEGRTAMSNDWARCCSPPLSGEYGSEWHKSVARMISVCVSGARAERSAMLPVLAHIADTEAAAVKVASVCGAVDAASSALVDSGNEKDAWGVRCSSALLRNISKGMTNLNEEIGEEQLDAFTRTMESLVQNLRLVEAREFAPELTPETARQLAGCIGQLSASHSCLAAEAVRCGAIETLEKCGADNREAAWAASVLRK
jgi:hypothetical protein